MANLQYWAIRKIGTQEYMLQRNGRGYTHHDFAVPSNSNIIRFFVSSHAATISLSFWCKGVWKPKRGYDPFSGEYESFTVLTPADRLRLRSEMEVVQFELVPIL